jgi:DNA anti-recombination protein RmuC
MFVPAENVYYEVIGRPELLTYGRECHVVPVSPNTMYAYIQGAGRWFPRHEIQEEAKRVQEMLAQLTTGSTSSRIISAWWRKHLRQREEPVRAGHARC